MAFENSPVYEEANKIMLSTTSYVSEYQYTFEFYNDKTTIGVSRLLEVFIGKDYVNNYTPVVICHVVVPTGTYETRIAPIRRDLRCRLIMKPVKDGSTETDTNRNKRNIEGKAALKELTSMADNFPNENFTEELGNKMGFTHLNIQIINPLIEKMMTMNASILGRAMTSPDYIKAFLLQYSKIIDNEKAYTVDGINIVEDGLNKEIIPNFIIPSNIKLIDVPGYVNSKISAIYPTGFGYFLERNRWFIYPLYNTRQAENCKSGYLTIIRVPKNTFPENKNSYRLQGKNVFILTNGDLNITEVSDRQQLNQGNGGRWVDAKNMMEHFVEVDNLGKKVVDAAKNVVELVIDEAKNKINNITGSGKITSNRFRELSKLSERNGSLASIQWPMSNADYIYPGMPVKVISWVNDKKKELYGSLLGVKEMIHTVTEGLANEPVYRRQAFLTLFLEKDVSGFTNIKDNNGDQ